MRACLILTASAVLAFGSLHAQTNGAAATNPAAKTDDLAAYEVWITGNVLLQGGVLFFQTDHAVAGDTQKNVVLLAATDYTKATLVPMYKRAAQKKVPVRLFGILIPYTNGPIKGHSGLLPNVEFVTWKIHDPSDPDVLPADQRITIDGNKTSLNGQSVQLKDAKTGQPIAAPQN